jgi:predicted secreted Zn-dependent protease
MRVETQFGRRHDGSPGFYQSLESRSGSKGLPWLLVALAVGALVVTLHTPHNRPHVSPADKAAIERVIAGGELSISALDGIPNVSVEYYDVDATDETSIRRELNAMGPTDEHGHHFDADTRWHYKWDWGPAPDGSCGAANAEVTFSAQIKMPRLTNFAALKPDVAESWRSYLTALVLHEAGHVRNGYAGREDVANAVRSSSCADANSAGNNVIARLREEDLRYDQLTAHGVKDGAQFG